MITVDEEYYIMSNAYVPEHSVGLMTCVFGGEPLLIEDYFCCLKGDRLIVVGYPLRQNFSIKEFEKAIDQITIKFRPKYLSIIALELPPSIAAYCKERERDHYYVLGVDNIKIKRGLRRIIDKTRDHFAVERSFEISSAHKELSSDFVERVKPLPRVRELLYRMEDYVAYTKDAIVLNAWDHEDNLAAFYVVDIAPHKFSTSVIGCFSEESYVSGVSDLLLFETIKISKEYGKNYVHLGLAVSKSLNQFNKKWRSKVTLTYEMCEIVV